MNRRYFITGSFGGLMAATTRGHTLPYEILHSATKEELELISDIPVFCAHEHWGSVEAIGMGTYGFRADMEAGAHPHGNVSIWDIVLDPYFGGWIAAAGYDVQKMAQKNGYDSFIGWWQNDPTIMLRTLEPALREQTLTGAFQCLRLGIAALHNEDIGAFDVKSWMNADAAVTRAYVDIFSWYRHVMDTMAISALVRPVHPEFFWTKSGQASRELEFTTPILRIDPLLDLWPTVCPRRDRLAELVGVEPRDAVSWRKFITALFDVAAQHGTVGIKQLQAYARDLAFARVSDSEVRFTGDLSSAEQRYFEDWVVQECCRQAHERHWPHQIHVGTHNLANSSPLPLEGLAKTYPNMKLVLLHCWPFLEEAGFLAKHWPNIYLDPCWLALLNPVFLRKSFDLWLGYVPVSKLMCSQDATSAEMAAGSILVLRHVLARMLAQRCEEVGASKSEVRAIAEHILHENGHTVYGKG